MHIPTKCSSSSASEKPIPKDKSVKLVYRSLLSQQVPAEKLNGLGSDHPVHILKTFIAQMTHDLINKLLEIVPALDDGNGGLDPSATDGSSSTSEEKLDTIVRNWFRRLVLARGQPDVLDLASRHTSIIGFLRSGVEPEELRKYIEYFENVDADALRHLRCAVSDSMSKDTRSTISLLGGSISTDDDFEELPTDMWDMVLDAFEEIISWYHLPFLYMNFADDLHLSKLFLLDRYGEEWMPEENPVRDSIGPFLGFVVSTQGSCDPPLPKIVTEEQGVRETEFRNYLAIRMSTMNPLAEALLVELKRRPRNYLVVAWKGAEFQNPVFQSEEDIFIKRTRTAQTEADLNEAPWEVLWGLSQVISDLRARRYLYRETYEDFMQIVVIDRVPGLPFELIHRMEDVLMELSGDPSNEEIWRKTIQDIIPPDERDAYLEAAVAASKLVMPRPTADDSQVSYEGNRSRCWDAKQILPSLLKSHNASRISVVQTRFISALCKDMESKGTIRIMEEVVVPQGLAHAFLGSDGKLDLYIDYRRLLATLRHDAWNSTYDLPPADSLLNFANLFDDRNSTAIYTKGSIATQYCAWPMDAMSLGSMGLPSFATPAGHLYQWVKAPFDFPYTAQFWQYLLSHHFRECAGFARFYLTTFVVCAVDQENAQANIRQLHEVAQRHGLRLYIPSSSMWAVDYKGIGLDKIYNGAKPAGYEE